MCLAINLLNTYTVHLFKSDEIIIRHVSFIFLVKLFTYKFTSSLDMIQRLSYSYHVMKDDNIDSGISEDDLI